MEGMRRPTPTVWVGRVPLGSAHPIAVQSMTNTPTQDVEATTAQVLALHRAGSEIVRLTVNDERAAQAVPEIKARLLDQGAEVPLVGDFHFNGHLLLRKYPKMAEALDKFRINPGTMGRGTHKDENFREMVRMAMDLGKPVRIGANWGSLDPALLTELMDQKRPAPRAQGGPRGGPRGPGGKHRPLLRGRFGDGPWGGQDRPLRQGLQGPGPPLGLPGAGPKDQSPPPPGPHRGRHGGQGDRGLGRRLGPLLLEGIGDTIRVSLTPAPQEPRTKEVEVAQEILQALGLRTFAPEVTSCPGCGRTTSTFFQELAEEVNLHLKARLPEWRRRYPGVEGLKVAVMGCVVNGPGESKHAHIGISLPGSGEEPKAPVYADGKLLTILKGETIAEDFLRLVEEYVKTRFAPKEA
jgi:(E)-4-hydroxy-3-methylbut-2-enyl-diphosphate synthase